MTFPADLETARRRVFELVGQTFLRYQKLEILIKRLLTLSHVRIEGPEIFHQNNANPKTSMGLAAKTLFERVIAPPVAAARPQRDDELGECTTPAVTATYRLQVSTEAWSAWRDRLNRLIDARNDLVHHSLMRMRLDTIEGCQHAIADLERLSAGLPAELDLFQRLCEWARETLREGIESGFDEMAIRTSNATAAQDAEADQRSAGTDQDGA